MRERLTRHELIEGWAGLAALTALSALLVSLPDGPWAAALPETLVFPFLLWFAIRCRPVFAAAAAFLWYPRLGQARLRAAAFVAMAVFSHWLLDALVHAPELPLVGADSMKLGLALGNRMPLALALEALFVLAGLCLFVPDAPLTRAKKTALTVMAILILAFTIAGSTGRRSAGSWSVALVTTTASLLGPVPGATVRPPTASARSIRA
jgi:hypothetical protein